MGLFELLIINDDLREMIINTASRDELRVKACEYGMVALRDSGIEAIHSGLTTIDEVIRETILDA